MLDIYGLGGQPCIGTWINSASASTPKAVIFFGAVLPHAFDLASLSIPKAIWIICLGMAIDSSIQISYLFVGTRLKAAIQSPKALKRVNRTSAGLIAGCAGWMAVSR
jgi:threonine/homoserine/homoserine lactone efflux protein